ncbi:YheC/YheD family endospore coat-associated protein [Calidifontibacillus erzurumensis]|uniref:YheC/YheD family protein n=1 Tax=Calidifontibacillus erzurumensis TaxID=2741433 RepID=A0A8J8KBU9_9BACI|nr:YheC/YheD family protein [Calidifontibacillus erzurumensis]NSL51982.1 YheC/YheD family protein [Calidifontibacillus erzurumensis]
MLTFGCLTLNKNIEREYFTQIAKKGRLFGFEVFCFSPADIDPKTELVHGKKYNPETENWDHSIFPIPTYIYDRCFYSSEDVLKKYGPIVQWMKNRKDIFFIGHGLPNKWKIYNELSSHPILKYYIPETIKAESADDIFNVLKKHKKIILKPENGAQGRGIIALSMKGRKIELITARHKKIIRKIFSKKDDLKKWLTQLLNVHSYLVQEYLPLHDEEMRPFDIRIFMQKTENNNWQELGRGIRKGIEGYIISNLHGGGTVEKFENFLRTVDRKKRQLLLEDIETIVTHLPQTLEQSFGPLFELGIDIGVAKDGSVWVLDTNSKPGHKTILLTNPAISEQLYSAPLTFCKQMDLQRS